MMFYFSRSLIIPKNGKDRIDHFEERVLKPAKAALDESCPYTFNYVKVRENPNKIGRAHV